MSDHKLLIEAALKARKSAYAPYSKFEVGAAIQDDNGSIIVGANVESASYGLSCCAERIAIFKAINEGYKNIYTITVASEGRAAPCGACRQIIAEFAPKALIIMIDAANPDSIQETYINSLLPEAFTSEDLPPN